MQSFEFFMPVHMYYGEDCVLKKKEVFKKFGKKAFLITGKNSAKKNGAQKDVITAMETLGMEWAIFDEIEENPSVETIVKGAEKGKKEKVDFVIGIGGGSPMDSAKAISCLLANPNADASILFGDTVSHVPVVEIPTTAGTGSETTQFSIVTLHDKRTKSSIKQKIFADASFLDAKYMKSLSSSTTNNTAIDALTHLIEAYLSVKANFFSDKLVEMGLDIFKDCMSALKEEKYPIEIREKLMLASTIAGISIAQAGTSLPHGMGYFLTYEKNIPHGRANGILTKAYLELFPERTKVNRILEFLNLASLDDLGEFLEEVLDTKEDFTEEEVIYYTEEVWKNKAKLASYPYPLTEKDLEIVYRKSLL